MAQKLRIISKRDGFRRCGNAHSEAPTFHDPSAFTQAQIDEMSADPMLVVDMVEVDEDGSAKVAPPAKASSKK